MAYLCLEDGRDERTEESRRLAKETHLAKDRLVFQAAGLFLFSDGRPASRP